MAMKICPDCGEKYSDTYKRCPFCEEEAAMGRRGGGRQRGGHRVSQRDPGVLSPILIIAIIVLGLLLVYRLRNVSFASAGQWLPECIAIAVTAGLHLWRRNSLLSIAGGTITYMLLVQVAFA